MNEIELRISESGRKRVTFKQITGEEIMRYPIGRPWRDTTIKEWIVRCLIKNYGKDLPNETYEKIEALVIELREGKTVDVTDMFKWGLKNGW